MAYGGMLCRACGAPISPDGEVIARLRARGRWSADSRGDCIYTCGCGISYSNSREEHDRRQISAVPEANVPEAVRSGLHDVLARAANVEHRSQKEWAFCSEASEDAVTWTVIRWLLQDEALDVLRERPQRSEPSVLMWGAPAGGTKGEATAEMLKAVSLDLGEPERRRSEPDCVLVWDDLVVFVEAKYHSTNPRQRDYPNFSRYLGRADLFAVATEVVAHAGLYELTRNWVLGAELAERLGRRSFSLINLGPPSVLGSASEFAGQLTQMPSRAFAHRTWSSVISAAPVKARERRWFTDYADRRRLASV